MSQNDESIVLTLLARARAGDDAARDELFSQCRNYVALIARTHVESWMQTKIDASDLVQTTLLEAHRGFAEFRGNTEAEWLAWLCKILQHNTHDFIRQFKGTDKRRIQKEGRLQTTGGNQSGSFFHDPPGHEQTPSQIIAAHEQQIELANAIAQLSDDHREVVILRNLQRLPFDEVAQRMDRTRPAVQMLWMRAIQKLQLSLTGDNDEEAS